MRTASLSQVRASFSKIENWLAAGEIVTITKRKKVVAELSPPRKKKKPDLAKRFALPANYKVRPGKNAVDLLIQERDSHRW
jgi:antitoxin (DNA-binding transcriptional repressor) of toxin-antitoxin stability system